MKVWSSKIGLASLSKFSLVQVLFLSNTILLLKEPLKLTCVICSVLAKLYPNLNLSIALEKQTKYVLSYARASLDTVGKSNPNEVR